MAVGQTSKRVLVVEDEFLIAMYIEKMPAIWESNSLAQLVPSIRALSGTLREFGRRDP